MTADLDNTLHPRELTVSDAVTPVIDQISVAQVINTQQPKPLKNECKHCRIAKYCLPSGLKNNKLHAFNKLNFTSHTLSPGEALVHQGQQTDHLFAVRSGMLKRVITQKDGKEFIMGFHLAPDIIGWEAIDPEQLTASLIAVDHVNVCEIPLKKWEVLIKETPELSTQMLRIMSHRHRFANLRELKTTAEQRVCNFLLEMKTFYARLGFPEHECSLPMSHQDIANFLRITPETISRTFKQLQKKCVIELSKTSRKKLLFKDMDLLKTLAEFHLL